MRVQDALLSFPALIFSILIVAALLFLGADAVSSLERGGELTVRSLDSIWGMANAGVTIYMA